MMTYSVRNIFMSTYTLKMNEKLCIVKVHYKISNKCLHTRLVMCVPPAYSVYARG